jgi:hypothetical protein
MEINDYGNVLKNTQNTMMKSKTTDNDYQGGSLTLEPPPSILMESQNRLAA